MVAACDDLVAHAILYFVSIILFQFQSHLVLIKRRILIYVCLTLGCFKQLVLNDSFENSFSPTCKVGCTGTIILIEVVGCFFYLLKALCAARWWILNVEIATLRAM